MKVFQRACPGILLGLFFHILAAAPSAHAQTFSNYPPSSIRIVELQGKVEIFQPPAKNWTLAKTNQTLQPFDRLRTGHNSRVALRWSDQSVVPFGASTELEILPPQNADSQSGLHLVRGILSFFHRDKPGRIQIITRGATAGIEGTEFVLAANDAGQTTMSVIDGKVRFASAQTELLLTNGQQAVAEPGQPPVQTAGFRANHVLQWCFYYPAVIDLSELNLNSETQSTLADSLAAYRSGDLLQALAKYPADRQLASTDEQIYHAALLLAVGQADQTESELAALPSDDTHAQALARALRQLIAAVKHDSFSTTLFANTAPLASERLAASYYEQSRNVRQRSLENALKLARQAVAQSPDFAFGWAHVAELEFSFGNTGAALDALEKSLALAPRNAQALALQGFLRSAKGQTTDAIASFNRALEIDAALANAWLGRGLCRIRQGDIATGREDLLIAAALEPQRAALRSYLGKSFGDGGDFVHADRELDLAKQLDPGDPTPWLYSAVVNQQNNRVNDAIRDLEKSLELNDNRSVYRSRLLIEQDHAMRSANLAQIYADAGLTDLGMREASRAVSYDYANYSAHWFLANSYGEMRGHNFVNTRFETPTFTEYLVANLLAPVDAGPLSPAISQSEYTRLFNQNGFGVYSDTQYLSRGAWSQNFAQYGTFDTFNYTLEAAYLSDSGQYRNNDLENKQLSLSLKQQITAQDSIYFRVDGAKLEGGDLSQHYRPADVSPDLRTREEQIPNLTLGYHHEWSPGVHTLLLLGRQQDEANARANNGALITAVSQGKAIAIDAFAESRRLRAKQELYSAELQQIFQQANHSTILGALYQHTDFNIRDFETTLNADYFPVVSDEGPLTIASLNLAPEFQRTSVYGYHSWQILDSLLLVGGLTYDRIELPRNWNDPPVSGRQTTKDQVSPKAGLVWTPGKNTTIRAAYTRSLSGASLDQSFRIEPSQVAGLNQSFRSLMSQSLVGATSGARLETFGLSLEQKFPTGTYIGLRGELLYSDVSRDRGSYFWDYDADDPWGTVTDFTLHEQLHSRERSVVFTLDQLIDREWTVGLRYRLTQAELDQKFTDSFAAAEPDAILIPLHQHLESLLHQVNLHANFNHASGFFASFEAVWHLQDNTGFGSAQPGDEFWHFNLLGGYRFFHRRAMIEAGILNLSNQDYRLNPLVWHDEPPRERTFVARLQFNF